jgi:hypothetical protein
MKTDTLLGIRGPARERGGDGTVSLISRDSYLPVASCWIEAGFYVILRPENRSRITAETELTSPCS